MYPHSMCENIMPVGTPTYFEGDISKIESNVFGFFELEVTALLNLNIPLLQSRIKIENGYKTISPVGKWLGIYFSEELK